MSSYDVIRRLKKMVPGEKIGHAGTLDPLAEGVLVVGIGRMATRTLATEVKKEKEYRAEVILGSESSTDDEEGEKKKWAVVHVPTREEVEHVLAQFVGTIMQTPPIYSALKVNGKAGYRYARAGHTVEMKPRAVVVKEIELIAYAWPRLTLRVVTGPGVYIRAIARDVGRVLQTGGYLAGLIRTRVGTYVIENALRLE